MYYQKNEDDCGLAAARNFLSLVFEDRSYEASHFDFKLNSFTEIQNGLKEYGVKVKGYEVDEKGLDKLKRPFIAQIKVNDSEHFVVVKKGKRILTIIDSAVGKVRMSKKVFLSIFTKKVLEIKEKEEIKKPKIRLISKKEEIIYFALGILESTILVAGLTLMTFLNHWYYLIGALFISILLSFVKRSYILKVNGKVDRRFILPFYRKDKSEKNYEALIKIKNNHFSFYCSFINELEIMLVMIVVAALQDIYLFIGAGIALLLTFVTTIGLNPYLRKYEMMAEKAETKLRDRLINDKEEDAIKYYLEEEKISKKYSFYYYMLRILPCIFSFVLVFVISYYRNELTFESIIFNIGYLVILSFNLLKMVNLENTSDPYLSSLADLKIINSLHVNKDGLLII